MSVIAIDDPAELEQLAADVRAHAGWLADRRSDDILAVLDRFARQLAESPIMGEIEGAGFLAFWLRRDNIERMLAQGLVGGRAVLDDFIELGGDRLKAFPAGLVCHWIAGNIPTLGIFSWVLSLITKNTALVRVSERTQDVVHALVDVFQHCDTPSLSARDLLATVRFLHFSRDDGAAHAAMSVQADCRVVWGSEDAVRSIQVLPRPMHCVDVIFGPKYSMGVIDRDVIDGDPAELQKLVTAFCRDAIVFDQRACSSPQTIFFERGSSSASSERVLDVFAESMTKLATANPKRFIDDFTASNIYAIRAAYSLAPDHAVRCSRSADWTVCADALVTLKTAVQSRTIFLTAVDDLRDVVPLLGPRIQTIGMACRDRTRAAAFANEAGKRGVARCVKPGLMNVYDVPWDGRLVFADLLRWMPVKGVL